MEYERILKIWSICLLITILGQMSGIFAGVVFGTEVFLLMYFFYLIFTLLKELQRKNYARKKWLRLAGCHGRKLSINIHFLIIRTIMIDVWLW